MFSEFRILDILHSFSGLVSQVGLGLLALGAWKMFLLTRRKTWLVTLSATGVSLGLGLFWWATSMLWSVLPFLDSVLSAIYESEKVITSLSVMHYVAQGGILLALAWEFARQLRKCPAALPSSE
jgi:hypothetical protein